MAEGHEDRGCRGGGRLGLERIIKIYVFLVISKEGERQNGQLRE